MYTTVKQEGNVSQNQSTPSGFISQTAACSTTHIDKDHSMSPTWLGLLPWETNHNSFWPRMVRTYMKMQISQNTAGTIRDFLQVFCYISRISHYQAIHSWCKSVFTVECQSYSSCGILKFHSLNYMNFRSSIIYLVIHDKNFVTSKSQVIHHQFATCFVFTLHTYL